MSLPFIIQGGMGVGVSNWKLARAVSKAGHLGVISGVGPDLLMMRRLQLGDPDGRLRQAYRAYPDQEIAEQIIEKYYVPGGKKASDKFKPIPMPLQRPTLAQQQSIVCGTFAAITMAKQGHDGIVGINLLEKIQAPTLMWLYGAILAGVDVVIVGAGIPREFPGYLDRLSQHEACEMKLHVEGATSGARHQVRLNPAEHFPENPPPVHRPKFFPIVSSVPLARMMVKKTQGKVDGLIVEMPSAGGHNAPPRGRLQIDEKGEPIYGARDVIDFEAIRSFGLPFWLAGSFGSPEGLRKARELGATGIQVGSMFAFCNESGIEPSIKQKVIDKVRAGKATVFTDPLASPTGFPFKVFPMEGTHSNEEVYESRRRICDLGYLRQAYEKDDGKLGWRCPSEPIAAYERKGGDPTDAEGRKCLCNALLATAGYGQGRGNGAQELPIVTSGDAVGSLTEICGDHRDSYSARDVIDYLLRKPDSEVRSKQKAAAPQTVKLA